MRMLKFLAAAVAVSTLASGAFAADLPNRKMAPQVYAPPPAPIFTWSGLYLGLNGGGWINNSSFSYGVGNGKLGGGGFLVGGTAGYNWQMGNGLVLGVEGDVDYRSKATVTPLAAASTTVGGGYLATARARLGYGFSRALVYVTGGLAAGTTMTPGAINSTIFGVNGVASSTPSAVGWTAGAGVEFAVNNNWSIKGEYLYADLGAHGVTYNTIGGALPASEKSAEHILRAGLNYRFNWGGAPAYSKY